MKRFVWLLLALLLVTAPHVVISQTLLAGSSATFTASNDTSTGTTVNLLAKLASTGALKAATTDINIPLYVVVSGAGTSGSAQLQSSGPVLCVMDATASSTSGYYVIASTSTAGRCHAQLAKPANGYLVGVLQSNSTTSGSTATIVAGNAYTPFRGIVFSIGDPAGSALSAASTTTDYVTVPFGCTISAYNLAVDAGTITVKFWKIATGTAIPTSSNSINTSGVAIASGTAIHSATLSDFTSTTITANDIMAMNVTAVSTAKYVTATLECN